MQAHVASPSSSLEAAALSLAQQNFYATRPGSPILASKGHDPDGARRLHEGKEPSRRDGGAVQRGLDTRCNGALDDARGTEAQEPENGGDEEAEKHGDLWMGSEEFCQRDPLLRNVREKSYRANSTVEFSFFFRSGVL